MAPKPARRSRRKVKSNNRAVVYGDRSECHTASTKIIQQTEESNIHEPSLSSLCSPPTPRRKRSKRTLICKKATNSGISEEQIGQEKSITSTAVAHPSSRPNRRPNQKRKRKKVDAESTDSEQIVPSFSRRRGQARRSVNINSTGQGKLTTLLLDKYLGAIWQRIPNHKKDSVTYIESLWFAMYSEEFGREKGLRWIKRENIFSKKYVFLPICKWSHWSLLIFCHLGGDLESKTASPCMLLLDSLQGAGPMRLEPHIRKFLFDIYKVEERPETKSQIYKIPLLVPKVPQQNDDKECGFFVLYYMNKFLLNYPESFSIRDGYPYFLKEDWFTVEEFRLFCGTLGSLDQEASLFNQQTNCDGDLCYRQDDDDGVVVLE